MDPADTITLDSIIDSRPTRYTHVKHKLLDEVSRFFVVVICLVANSHGEGEMRRFAI